MSRFFLAALAVLLGCGLIFAQPPGVGPVEVKPEPIKLSSSPGAMAIERDSGALVIAFPTENKIRLYNDISTGQPDAEFDCKGAPNYVGFTRVDGQARLVVNVEHGKKLFVFDKALKPLGEIALSYSPQAHVALAENGQCPYAYYASQAGGYDMTPHRVDLKAMKDDVDVDVAGLGFDAHWLTLSANGNFLYGHRIGTSPSGVFCWRVVDRAGKGVKLETSYNQHATAYGYVTDDQERYVANSTGVYSADMREQVAKVPGKPIGFLPGTPYYFCSTGENFTAQAVSLNGGGVTAAIRVRSMAQSSRGIAELQAVLDAKHKRLIFLDDTSEAGVVNLGEFGKLDEPDLSVTPAGSLSTLLGQPINVPLKVAAGATVQLKDGPEGLSLQDGQLVWPEVKQRVGHSAVSLLVQSGQIQRLQTLTIDVERPLISLPFAMRAARLSPDGSKLLVLSETADSLRNRGIAVKTELAVVDLAAKKVIATSSSPRQVASFEISNTYAILSYADGQVASVLKLSDLSEAATPGVQGRLNAVGILNDKIAVLTTQGGSGGGMELVSYGYDIAAKKDLGVLPGGGVVKTTALGHWVGTTLLDTETLKPIATYNTVAIPAFRVEWNGGQRNAFSPRDRYPVPYDPNTARQFDQPSMVQTLAGAPVVVSLASKSDYDGNDPRRREMPASRGLLDLSVAAVDSPAKTQTVRVMETGLINGAPLTAQFSLDEHDGRAVAVVVGGDQVAIVDLSPMIKQLQLSDLPYIAKVEPVIAIDAVKAASVPVFVSGGQKPLQFELAAPIDGVSIDHATGTVTIDPQSILPRAARQVATQLRNGMSATDAFVAARAEFARLAGRPTQGVPISIVIDEAITDSAGHRLYWPRVVLAELPNKQVDDAAAQAPPAAGAGNQGVPPQVMQRLIELERENAALKAQVDMLKAQMQQNQPATKP